MRILSVGVAVFVVLGAGCAQREGLVESNQAVAAAVREAVTKRMEDYLAAARTDQLDALPDYWAEDVQVFEDEIEFHNRAEMMAMVTGALETMKLDEATLTTFDVFVHDGGTVAYHFAAVDETLTARDGSVAPMRLGFNFMARWIKEADGVWRIDRFIEAPMPLESAGPEADR